MLHWRQSGGVGVIEAGRVAEAAVAKAQFSSRVEHAPIAGLSDVEDDIVRAGGITRDAADRRARRPEAVEVEIVTHLPGDHVVRARSIAADPDTTYFLAAGGQ